MSLLDKIEIPRRTMVLFFIIDTSGSMDGNKIGAVNVAIEEIIPAIREVSNENADAQIKIAVLEFSNGARWLTPNGPVEADRFNWSYLYADGLTDFGNACAALNEKLSTKAFMQEATGSFAPAFFLLSDGDPTDDWQYSLTALKQNNWFRAGVKVAIAIGDDANRAILKEFTGSSESVLEVHNTAMLKRMIKFVSIRASQVASKNTNVGDLGDAQKQQELNTSLQDFIAEEVAITPDLSDEDW